MVTEKALAGASIDILVEFERSVIGWLIDHGYEFELNGHNNTKHKLTIWIKPADSTKEDR